MRHIVERRLNDSNACSSPFTSSKTLYLSLGTCVAAADIPDGYYPDDTSTLTKSDLIR